MKTIVLLFIISLNLVQAQEETKITVVQESKNIFKNNRVGLTYSMMSGYGLTYLRSFENNFSIKTQLYLYGSVDANDTEYRDNSLKLAIGAELQYNLAKFQSNRLYVLAGFYYDYDYSLYDYLLHTKDEVVKKNAFDITRHYNVGLGIGFEVYLLNNISVAFDGGYYGEIKNNNQADFYTVKETSKSIGFGFAGGISLYYNF